MVNPAAPADLLQEILQWRSQGTEISDNISRFRPRTVPAGYTYCKWKPSKEIQIVVFIVQLVCLYVYM